MMIRLAALALCAVQTAAFAAPAAFAPAVLPARPALQAGMPLRQQRGAALSMTAKPQGLRAACKKLVTAAALSLCLLAGTPMKVSAQTAAATDFDFEDDLMDDEMSLVDQKPKAVEIDYTGLRKLSFQEEVMKYGILVGIFGGGVAWSYWEGKKADREEEARVKAEVERIEKWKKEFIDMDDVVSDDDMFASLQKRLSGEGKEDVEGLDGSGSVPEGYNPETAILQEQMKKIEKEAQAKREKEEEAAKKAEDELFSQLKKEVSEEMAEDKVAEVDSEQMERLKRMFGSADAKDSTDDKDKKDKK